VTVALVTGASSGIGEAIAVQLASQGIQTFGAARGIVKMEKLVAAGGTALSLDLTLPASIDDCIEQVIAKAGRIDILVNAAGAALYGAIEDVSLEDARTLFDVNLFGAAALIQKVAPLMRAQRAGHIINISTVGGVIASPYGGWYHATKFALEGLSASLRQEAEPVRRRRRRDPARGDPLRMARDRRCDADREFWRRTLQESPPGRCTTNI
jgi:NADP-dependent 3-hydroxy acid dehydrogenase YdfG